MHQQELKYDSFFFRNMCILDWGEDHFLVASLPKSRLHETSKQIGCLQWSQTTIHKALHKVVSAMGHRYVLSDFFYNINTRVLNW